MRDIVERLELQAFVADKIQSGMKPLIMDCLEEITHLRCQYEALHKQGEMNARLLTENAELRERLAEADEANRRVSDENAKLRDELITSSDAAKYYDYGYSCARDMQKDKITHLRAENEKLREALRPLAKAYEEFMRINDCTEYEIANDPYLHTAAAAIRESGDAH